MKKLMSFTFPALILFIVFSTSCKKSSTPIPVPTNTALISSASWKFNKATSSGIDVSSQIPACFKDNTITLVSNGTGTITEGALVCAPPAPATFTWSFLNSETQINFSVPLINGGSSTFNVVKLTSDEMQLSQNLTIPPSSTAVSVEVKFVH